MLSRATSPRARRTLSSASAGLAGANGRRSTVVITGAGMDKALNPNAPSWVTLIDQLAVDVAAYESEGLDDSAASEWGVDQSVLQDRQANRRMSSVAVLSDQWPMEAAEAIRVSVGSKEFLDRLTVEVANSRNVRSSAVGNTIAALSSLALRGVGCFLDLNYTDDVANALTVGLAHAGVKVRISHLSTLQAHTLREVLEPPDGVVNVVKVHGSVPGKVFNEATGIILDRSSYARATAEGALYRDLLRRVFEDFQVVTLGVSWTDVALREAAAQAALKRPTSSLRHIVVRLQESGAVAEWWRERMYASSYGAMSIAYLSHSEFPGVVTQIGESSARDHDRRRENSAPSDGSADITPASDSMNDIADFLDGCGDFDSPLQSAWFGDSFEDLAQTIRQEVQQSPPKTAEQWLTYARIERHLRHFVWFRLPSKKRIQLRSDLWTSIAAAFDALRETEQDNLWRPDAVAYCVAGRGSPIDAVAHRAAFDFALGQIEINPGGNASHTWGERVSSLREFDTVGTARDRIDVGHMIWRPARIATST